ncbi:hypothetical protein COY17_00660 [Candidatus Saccharibacteria bacterium CG_4_10_14_0_2_um_filter_52_9]|nr:MAG: hypothetical protein COY17_00660 [Candidatus Saccharibacteria bacterium CG_4_10_14_0_2_um_filter_52_9]
MPDQVKGLEGKIKMEVRVCFLGMSKADLGTILKYAGPATWLLTDLTEKQRQEYPEWLVKNSEEVKRQCEKYGYRYFDLAGDYETQFGQAYKYLAG